MFISNFFSVVATLLTGQSCKNTEDNKYALFSPRQMASSEVMSQASFVFLERTDVRERSIQTFQASPFRIIYNMMCALDDIFSCNNSKRILSFVSSRCELL